jgi:hypothetical protein
VPHCGTTFDEYFRIEGSKHGNTVEAIEGYSDIFGEICSVLQV